MNSAPVARQGLVARLLVKIRGLEKAKLCDVVDGLSEPPNFLEVFLTPYCGLMDCFDGLLPAGSFPDQPVSADGPIQPFEDHLALKESFGPVAPMVSQMENWTNQQSGWIEIKGLLEG